MASSPAFLSMSMGEEDLFDGATILNFLVVVNSLALIVIRIFVLVLKGFPPLGDENTGEKVSHRLIGKSY